MGDAQGEENVVDAGVVERDPLLGAAVTVSKESVVDVIANEAEAVAKEEPEKQEQEQEQVAEKEKEDEKEKQDKKEKEAEASKQARDAEMDALLQDFSAINMELNTSKAQIYDLTSRNNALTKELAAMQKQCTQSEKALRKAQLAMKFSRDKKKAAAILEENEELRTQLSALKDILRAQQTAAAAGQSTSDRGSDNDALSSSSSSSTTTTTNPPLPERRSSKIAETMAKAQQEELLRLRQELDETKAKLKATFPKLEQLLKANAALKANSADEKIASLEKERDDAVETLRSFGEAQQETLAKMKADTVVQVQIAKDELKRAQKKRDEATAESLRVTEQLADTSASLEAAQGELESVRATADRLQAELDEATEREGVLHAQTVSAEAKLRNLLDMKWQESAEAAEARASVAETEIERLQSELDAAEAKKQEKEVELKSVKRKYGVVVKDLRVAVRRETKAAETLRREAAEATAAIEELKREHSRALGEAHKGTASSKPKNSGSSGAVDADGVKLALAKRLEQLLEENEKLKIKVSHLEDIVQQITLELEQKKLVVEAAATSASRRSSLIAEKPSS